MTIKRVVPFMLLLVALLAATACYRTSFSSPHGYNLVRPDRTELNSSSLAEISGIAFHGRSFDTFYAINDEHGKLFYFTRSNPKPVSAKFGRSGDYEDVTITKEKVVVLKSDGELFVFPFSLAHQTEVDSAVTKVAQLPKSEYEGLYADSTGRLYVLCKHCEADNPNKAITVYTLVPDSAATYRLDKTISIDVNMIKKLSDEKRMRFNPSCLAQHPITKEWYIISSVNKLLVITDPDFNVKEAYALKPNLFRQPEGLAFDARGNMYITNEGKEDEVADLMMFPYKP
ncbi:SdiA-regulated domain-containing protein [Deminuibacter soli]|uniref:SdiA-regulated family protein n=1 Tax=Deminuibacter soli TaxID=2291815 RepID=A0A3E1NLW8_9BACT|nr:SdiA-regulated domain-containing protein [Deminuibacter soli]RFM28930.1 SdiA-regulated family protein [Deminuibacter soli]